MISEPAISERGLLALRAAATLTHVVPGLRACVRGPAGVVLDVTTEPDRAQEGVRVLGPCAFRSAVVAAWRLHEAGQHLAFLDLPDGVDPAIDIGVPPGGFTFAAGIHRVPIGDRWLYAFATTVPAPEAHAMSADIGSQADAMPHLQALGLRGDVETEVTVAYAETSSSREFDAELAVVTLMEQLLARFATSELLAGFEVADATGDPDR